MTETSYSCLDALFLPHRLPHNDLKRQQRGKTPLCCWSYGFLWNKKGAHTESRWLRYSEEKHGNHSKTQLSLDVTNSSVWRLWTNADKIGRDWFSPIKTDYKGCFSSGLLWGDENNPWSFAFKVTENCFCHTWMWTWLIFFSMMKHTNTRWWPTKTAGSTLLLWAFRSCHSLRVTKKEMKTEWKRKIATWERGIVHTDCGTSYIKAHIHVATAGAKDPSLNVHFYDFSVS